MNLATSGLLSGLSEAANQFRGAYNDERDRKIKQQELAERRQMLAEEMARHNRQEDLQRAQFFHQTHPEYKVSLPGQPGPGILNSQPAPQAEPQQGILSRGTGIIPKEETQPVPSESVKVGSYGFEKDPNYKTPEQKQIEAEERKTKTTEAKEEKKRLEESKVPDFEIAAGYQPKPQAIEKFRAEKAAGENMIQKMDDIKDLISDSNIFQRLSPTEQQQKLRSKVKALQIAAKTYNGLGVLNGPDMGLLLEQFGDPTSVWDNIRKAGNPENFKALLDGAIEATKEGTSLNAYNLGMRPAKGSQYGEVSQGKNAPGLLKNTKASVSSPEDIEAIKWAKANPNDPRAAQIMKLHEGQ